MIDSSLPHIKEHATRLYSKDIFNKVKVQIVNAGGLNMTHRTKALDKVM